jgi:hypothetical protein
MSFDSYPLRMVLTIGITVGGIMLIIGIVRSAPNFLVAMLILLPLVPLLRLVGDIANPDVDVPLQPRILLRDYLFGGFFLLIMFGAILLTVPVVGVGLTMLGAALAVLVGVVGVLLWALQYGLGITLGRSLAFTEIWDSLFYLGAGIGAGVLAFGLVYLGTIIKDRYEGPLWHWIEQVRARIAALGDD